MGRGRGARRGRARAQRRERGLRTRLQPGSRARAGSPPRLPQLRLRAGARLARRARAVRRRRPRRGRGAGRRPAPRRHGQHRGQPLHYLGFSWAPNGDAFRPPGRRRRSRWARGRACSCPHGASARSADSGRPCSCTARTPTSAGGCAWRGCASSCARRRASCTTTTSAATRPSIYHLERNRLMMLAANYELSTLARLAPALLGTELALLAVAVRERLAAAEAAGTLLGGTVAPRGARAAPRGLTAAAHSRQRLLAPARAAARAGVRRRRSRASAHRCSRPTPASSGSRRAQRRRRQGGCARTTRPARDGAASQATASASVCAGASSAASARPAWACAWRAAGSPSSAREGACRGRGVARRDRRGSARLDGARPERVSLRADEWARRR